MALSELTSSDAGALARDKINPAIREASKVPNLSTMLGSVADRLAGVDTRSAADLRTFRESTGVSLAALLSSTASLSTLKANAADLTALAARVTAQRFAGILQATRPGVNALAFALTPSPLALGGPAEALPEVPANLLTFSSDGPVVRLTAPSVVGMRSAVGIEPGRVYRARAVVRRRANSADPSNDTVAVALAWIGQGGGVVGTSPVATLTALTVSDGRRVVQADFARSALTANLGLLAPAQAVAARLCVQSYASTGLTDVEVLSISDVTDLAAPSPVAVDLNARVAAIESQGLPDKVAALQAQAQNPNSLTFPTRSDAQAALIPAGVTTLVLRGLVSAGDGLGRDHKRVAAPTTDASFRSADGAYWQRIDGTVLDSDIGSVKAASIRFNAGFSGALDRSVFDIIAPRLRGSDVGLRSTYQDSAPIDAAPIVQKLLAAVPNGQTRAIDLDVPGFLNVSSYTPGVSGRRIVLRAEPGTAFGGALGLKGLQYDLYEGYEPANFSGKQITRTYRFGDSNRVDPAWHGPTWERGQFRVSTILDFPGITNSQQATEFGGLFMSLAPDLSVQEDALGLVFDPGIRFCEKDALVGWSRTEAGFNHQVVGVRGYNEIATPQTAANGRTGNAGIGWGGNFVAKTLDGALGYSLGVEINTRQATTKATAKPGGYDSIGLKIVTIGDGDHSTAAIYIQKNGRGYYNGLIADQEAFPADSRARFIELSNTIDPANRGNVWSVDRDGSHYGVTWGINNPTGYARFNTVAASTLRVGDAGAERKVIAKSFTSLADGDSVLVLE